MFKKITYWISTGVVLLLLAWAVFSYHFLHVEASKFFEIFGYPTYLVYPLAWLKLIAIIVIVSHRYNDLRDMVYAAYFINMAMALTSHVLYGDFYGHALVGLICLPISYLLGNQVRLRPSKNFFGKWTNPKVSA
jgi:hypothetical protein